MRSLLVATSAALLCAVYPVPLFAAPANVPLCDWDGGSESEATSDFLERLQLQTNPGATVNIWSGCFKVTYRNAEGHYVTEYYDPDTNKRIR